MTTGVDRTRRADEDAALVIALIAAMAETPVATPNLALWGDPAHRLRGLAPARSTWWASGLPT